MNDGFVKIYGTRLITSSLWEEAPEARLVFLGMLALANWDGYVPTPTTSSLARMLNLHESYVLDALAVLEAPDPKSRSSAQDGRRVVRTTDPAGWLIVNIPAYREFRSKAQEDGRKRAARWRERKMSRGEESEAMRLGRMSVRERGE